MPNQWKFNEALSNAGNSFANAIYRNSSREQQLEDEERRREERETEKRDYFKFTQDERSKQDLLEQERTNASNSKIANLLRGGESQLVGQSNYDPNNALATEPRKESFVPYDKPKIAQILSGMSPQEINKFQDIQSSLSPKPKEYVNYQFNDPKAIWAINKETSQLEKVQDGNPAYKPSRLSTVTNYEKNGRQVTKIFYEDGKTKIIPTGFYKDEKGKERFNPDDANKSLSHYSDEYAKLQRLKSAYQKGQGVDESGNPIRSPMLKDALNAQIGDTENELYNFLDPESVEFINENYSKIRKTAESKGLTLEKYEADYPEEIKKKFQEGVGLNYKGTKEDYAHKRALILWSNFKYGYAR